MATSIITAFASLFGGKGDDKKETGPAGGAEGAKKRGEKPDVGAPTGGDSPQEGGGVTFRPGPEGPTGRQSPTTRFPFGSSILGEGRSLFPDTSVTGTGNPRSQPSTSGIAKRRKKTGFGIA